MRTAARATPHAPTGVQRSVREILMGAQDNLTNVLAVVLGVSIGSGEMRTVALAGLAAGVAEAISMGGVLYTSTRAAQDLRVQMGSGADGSAPADRTTSGPTPLLGPLAAGLVTFASAAVAAAIPLIPFAFLSLQRAMVASASVSVAALFVLGAWTATITRRSWWRAGLQIVIIGTVAALAAAAVGAALKSSPG